MSFIEVLTNILQQILTTHLCITYHDTTPILARAAATARFDELPHRTHARARARAPAPKQVPERPRAQARVPARARARVPAVAEGLAIRAVVAAAAVSATSC